MLRRIMYYFKYKQLLRVKSAWLELHQEMESVLKVHFGHPSVDIEV